MPAVDTTFRGAQRRRDVKRDGRIDEGGSRSGQNNTGGSLQSSRRRRRRPVPRSRGGGPTWTRNTWEQRKNPRTVHHSATQAFQGHQAHRVGPLARDVPFETAALLAAPLLLRRIPCPQNRSNTW